MPESLLPLTQVRRYRLTLADLSILRAASRELAVSEAEVMRIALRRFALYDPHSGLKTATVAALKTECAGLPMGPAVAPVLPPASVLLLDLIHHEPAHVPPPARDISAAEGGDPLE